MNYPKTTGSWHPQFEILGFCRSHLSDKIFLELGVLDDTMRSPNWSDVTVFLNFMDDNICIRHFYLIF
jgi:hypothetical protein